MKAQEFLSRVASVKKTANGWQAKCPAHDDRKASLSIAEGGKGIVLTCQAGCDTRAVVEALGLTLSDLFAASSTTHSLAQGASNGTPKRHIVATYDYTNEQGQLLFQAIRYEPKGFSQRRPDGKGGGWLNNLEGVRRVLYRLPELLDADEAETVFLCEGEKDVEALRTLGLVATCNPMGAGKWRDEYNEALHGRTVVILPDNDKAGNEHAETQARSLYRIASQVKILRLPDLPDKGDVSDWLAAGGSAEALACLATNVPAWLPETATTKPNTTREAPALLMTWGQFGSIERKRGEQIIHELERGEIGMLAAITNVGKSTLIRNLALTLACGGEFAPLAKQGKPRRVLLLDFETRAAKLQSDIATMLTGCTQSERDLVAENFAVCCDAMIEDEPLTLSNRRHLEYVQMNAAAFKADLIIVDTVAAGFEVHEENSNAEVTARILKPLVRLAKEADASLLYAHHIGKAKSEEGQSAEKAYRARGASSFAAFASIVLNLTQDASDPDRVTLSLAKVKGERFEDVNLKLDRNSRWFVVAGSPVNLTRTSYQLVVELIRSRGGIRTREILAALSGEVAERTVKRCLSEGVKKGDLEMPKAGTYQVCATCATPISNGTSGTKPTAAKSTTYESANSANLIGVAQVAQIPVDSDEEVF